MVRKFGMAPLSSVKSLLKTSCNLVPPMLILGCVRRAGVSVTPNGPYSFLGWMWKAMSKPADHIPSDTLLGNQLFSHSIWAIILHPHEFRQFFKVLSSTV